MKYMPEKIFAKTDAGLLLYSFISCLDIFCHGRKMVWCFREYHPSGKNVKGQLTFIFLCNFRHDGTESITPSAIRIVAIIDRRLYLGHLFSFLLTVLPRTFGAKNSKFKIQILKAR